MRQRNFCSAWDSNRCASVIIKKLARIEILKEEMGRLIDPELKRARSQPSEKIGYAYVTLDLQGFRSGSMNEVL